MIFGTYKLHNAEKEMMLSLWHYVNSYSPEGATNNTFYLHYSSFTFSYFLHRNSAFFLHSLLKFYSKQKFVWFCYLVLLSALYIFANSYLFYLFFFVKNDDV